MHKKIVRLIALSAIFGTSLFANSSNEHFYGWDITMDIVDDCKAIGAPCDSCTWMLQYAKICRPGSPGDCDEFENQNQFITVTCSGCGCNSGGW